jgi:hypothetical protein
MARPVAFGAAGGGFYFFKDGPKPVGGRFEIGHG